VKRFLIIGILVAILFSGAVAVTAMAAPPSSRGAGVVMESGYGLLSSGSADSDIAYFYYPQVAHISVTVIPVRPESYDRVVIDSGEGEWTAVVIVDCDTPYAKTVEFDSKNWRLSLQTYSESSVKYYYTVTYPGTR